MIIDENKLSKIKKKALEENVPILQDSSLEYILEILKKTKPSSILEIGTAVGYSAINFARYLEDGGRILTIEISESKYKEALENIKDLKLDNIIEVINANAVEYLPNLDEEFDVIFIDAAKGQYMNFLNQAKRMIKKDGIIIADNVFFKGRVMNGYNEHKHRTAVNKLREYIKDVTNDINFNTEIIDIGDGVAISIKK